LDFILESFGPDPMPGRTSGPLPKGRTLVRKLNTSWFRWVALNDLYLKGAEREL